MTRCLMRVGAVAAMLLSALLSAEAAAQGCCTHQGGSVACPGGLPPGSQSVQFVPGGTQWRTPDGQIVTIGQTTFAGCAPSSPPPPVKPPPVEKPPTPPTPPPVQPPTPPPVQPPTPPPVQPPMPPPVQPPTPPVQTPSTPTLQTPPPSKDSPQQRPPVVPPTDVGRTNEDRARRLIESPPPPIVVVPPTRDDDKTTDEMIRRVGEEIGNQKRGEPPKTPPPTSPTGDTTTQSTPAACPQRGRGCVALLLNFATYAYANGVSDAEEPDELGAVKDLLNALHCSTIYVEPNIKSTVAYTHKYYIGIAGKGIHFSVEWNPSGDEIEHNKKEMDKIADEVTKHRKAVASTKPEIAIEMVSAHGHGSDLAPGDTFGWWSPHREWNRNHLPRGAFHSGNYEAAKGNVCQWFVYDSSCFAATPRAVDTLNNVGTATYTEKPTDNCALHAAYESDIAVAASTPATCSILAEASKLVEDTIVSALRTIAAYRTDVSYGRQTAGNEPRFIDIIKKPLKEKYPSWYFDDGYKDKDKNCPPAERKGYQFTAKPMPPP